MAAVTGEIHTKQKLLWPRKGLGMDNLFILVYRRYFEDVIFFFQVKNESDTLKV